VLNLNFFLSVLDILLKLNLFFSKSLVSMDNYVGASVKVCGFKERCSLFF
jgi:hypothetical protein